MMLLMEHCYSFLKVARKVIHFNSFNSAGIKYSRQGKTSVLQTEPLSSGEFANTLVSGGNKTF